MKMILAMFLQQMEVKCNQIKEYESVPTKQYTKNKCKPRPWKLSEMMGDMAILYINIVQKYPRK